MTATPIDGAQAERAEPAAAVEGTALDASPQHDAPQHETRERDRDRGRDRGERGARERGDRERGRERKGREPGRGREREEPDSKVIGFGNDIPAFMMRAVKLPPPSAAKADLDEDILEDDDLIDDEAAMDEPEIQAGSEAGPASNQDGN